MTTPDEGLVALLARLVYAVEPLIEARHRHGPALMDDCCIASARSHEAAVIVAEEFGPGWRSLDWVRELR